LHAAAAHGWNGELIRWLIGAGAELNVVDDEGYTPLDVVYRMGFLGGRSLAHWMKTQGARTNRKKQRSAGES
jgi:hypothetical protein